MLSQRSQLVMKLVQQQTDNHNTTDHAASSIGNNNILSEAVKNDNSFTHEAELPTLNVHSLQNLDFASFSSDDGSQSSTVHHVDPFHNSDDTDEDPDYLSDSNSASSSQSNDEAVVGNSVIEVVPRDISSTEHDNNIMKRTRKRKLNPSEWKKNAAKLARNTGRQYVSCSKSEKLMKAREMKPPCKNNCTLKCNAKIIEETRQQIFENYWSLGDSQRQQDYLASCMTPITPKYQYHRNESKRRDNNAFHFIINGNHIRVCKLFFKSTLDITDRPIRTVIAKRTGTGGMISVDLRGKHGKHLKLDPNIKEGIRKHINSIPRLESHYSRARSSREFIEGGKTVRDLHRDYVQECKNNNLPFAKYLMYHQIFTREFNISFFTPKKDQCGVCATYATASEEEKENLKDEYEIHLSEKELSRAEKQADKDKISQNYVVACFDLQAVLPCPQGDTSTFYYKSKLGVFNFTVYEIRHKMQGDQCYCYVWDETQGRRGANEIGSCLLKYIEEISTANPDGETEIIFYSDNCVGQQKNRFILTMYIYALLTYPNIKSKTHKFLMVGHTQNEGDSAHSVIERQVKRYLKSGPIFIPSEYVGLIKSAKKTGSKYKVQEMSYTEFVDLKKLNETIGNIDGRSNKDDKMADMKIIQIERDDPFTIRYKTTYTQEDYCTLTIQKPRATVNTRTPRRTQLALQPLYKEKIKIPEKKKKGLLELLKHNHIPPRHAEFYKNL